ncbi:MAG: HIT family protein [bacterium]
MENCIFCKIISGLIPSNKVYEDDFTFAFMDISPINPGHLLVVPKKHFTETKDYDEETGNHLFNTAIKIEKALRKSNVVTCQGTNFFIANGAAAGQEVFHSHLHIIPRYKGDNFKLRIEKSDKPTMEELKNIALIINNNI